MYILYQLIFQTLIIKIHLVLDKPFLMNEGTANIQDQRMDDFSDGANEGIVQHGNGDFREANQIRENDSRSPKTSAVRFSDEGGENLTEQFEPGVYVTLVQLPNGTKVFKRVRFR